MKQLMVKDLNISVMVRDLSLNIIEKTYGKGLEL